MNILFTAEDALHPLHGGVGRVTDTLCKVLQRRGHTVHYINRRWKSETDDDYDYPAPVSVIPFNSDNDTERLAEYHKFLADNTIDLVINQDALFVLFFNNVGDLPVKVVSVLHNNPLFDYEHLWSDFLVLRDNSFKEKLKRIARCVLYFREKRRLREHTIRHFGQLTAMSDKIITLSPFFIDALSELGCDTSKCDFIYNPNTYPLQQSIGKKEKELLFVGRLHNRSKRLLTLLKIWQRLWRDYPEWHLSIVGDGPDRAMLEACAAKMELQNISFEGFKDPVRYYRRASIICMTSSFEGWGMVLTEGMQFGCIPVAFDSYRAVHDLILPGNTGELVRPFCVGEYCDVLRGLLNSEKLRSKMSAAAFEHVRKFDIAPIAEKWETLLTEMRKR